jgi:DNA gyrase/topoisomerase IV subunit B
MSIGEFLDVSMKLQPSIQSRIKGLGELNGDDLRKTTLDINHRISEQYTVDDVERELGIFELTHGKSKQAALDRKKLMREYKINREDLDN